MYTNMNTFDDSKRSNSRDTLNGTLRTKFQNKMICRKTNEYDTPIFNLDSKSGGIRVKSHDDSIAEFSVNDKENLFSLKKMNVNDTIHKHPSQNQNNSELFNQTGYNSFTSKLSAHKSSIMDNSYSIEVNKNDCYQGLSKLKGIVHEYKKMKQREFEDQFSDTDVSFNFTKLAPNNAIIKTPPKNGNFSSYHSTYNSGGQPEKKFNSNGFQGSNGFKGNHNITNSLLGSNSNNEKGGFGSSTNQNSNSGYNETSIGTNQNHLLDTDYDTWNN
jgi:hypothetical protein